MSASRQSVSDTIQSWPEGPRQRAQQMMDKYGDPSEVTPTQVTWYNNGPWKRTVVYREAIPHHFPKKHEDYLAQTILYQVPPEKVDEIARFDGSVIIDRTAGEVTGRCDKEVANILSLNLMHDIVTGNMSVEDARQKYAMTMVAHMAKQDTPYMEQFQFDLPRGDTNDVDQSNITQSMMQEAKEKFGELFGGEEKAA